MLQEVFIHHREHRATVLPSGNFSRPQMRGCRQQSPGERTGAYQCLSSQAGRGDTVKELPDKSRAAIYANLKTRYFLKEDDPDKSASNCLNYQLASQTAGQHCPEGEQPEANIC